MGWVKGVTVLLAAATNGCLNVYIEASSLEAAAEISSHWRPKRNHYGFLK